MFKIDKNSFRSGKLQAVYSVAFFRCGPESTYYKSFWTRICTLIIFSVVKNLWNAPLNYRNRISISGIFVTFLNFPEQLNQWYFVNFKWFSFMPIVNVLWYVPNGVIANYGGGELNGLEWTSVETEVNLNSVNLFFWVAFYVQYLPVI